ncbi:MAG TPA: DNA-directed RNA polymerase subunit B'' [Candidatus Nanoarchaeia archaeon]|nr:DNA-directed RNA polymerase subunit B'' [Candidatus Nanoarchaeia archaeon]
MVEGYQALIEAHFEENPFGSANLKSFNTFLEKSMQKLIDEIGDIIPTIIPQEVESFIIKLKKIWVEKPSIIEADGSKREVYPYETRLRGLTYSAPIYLEVSAYIDDIQRENFTCLVGKLPIMVKSKHCHLYNLKKEELIQKGEDPYDPGGYFIINGNERVLITVEDLASNKLFIEEKKGEEISGRLFSEMGSYRIPHNIELMKDGIIYISFTRFNKIPIITALKALGLTKEQDIMKEIVSEEFNDIMFINFYESAEIKTQDDALEYLGRKMGVTQPREIKIEKCNEQIDRYFLPHLGLEPKDRLCKAYNLCKILKRFLKMVLQQNREDYPDKDHYMNKRLKLSGDLLEDLVRSNLRSLVQDILYNFQRLVKRGKFQSIKIIIRDELLTSNLKSSLATGSWTGGRKGISQNIDRTNAIASNSHLQRVVSLLTSTQENFNARALHSTHWGRLCPIETPEGTPIGLRKNMALLSDVTTGDLDEITLKKQLEELGVK